MEQAPNNPAQPKTKRQRLIAPDPHVLPPKYRELAVEEGAVEGTLKLILCKRLQETDMKSRLGMPANQIKNGNFLNPGEEDFINKSVQWKKKKINNKMKVIVIDPSGKKRAMSLAKWKFAESNVEKKNKSWRFVLANEWNDLVKENSLSVRDPVQVWSFRKINGDLSFIIHKNDRGD